VGGAGARSEVGRAGAGVGGGGGAGAGASVYLQKWQKCANVVVFWFSMRILRYSQQ